MESDSFEQRIWTLLGQIPSGRVTTYGQLAAMAGFPGYARQVGRALKQLPKDSRLPWFRVINASGKISFPVGSEAFELQRMLLESEGVVILSGRVKLSEFAWQPGQ